MSWTERLKGVFIDQMDAFDLIRKWDGPDTLFYVDPPYMRDTRTTRRAYSHEMDDADHERLAELLHSIQGLVMISGYPHPLYDQLYAGWRRVECKALADKKRGTTEVIWLSPNTRQDLFSQAGYCLCGSGGG